MKKVVKVYFMVLVSFLFIHHVSAATNPYKETSRYGVNCTWYTWNKVYNTLGIALPGWGNANTWYDYARKAGYSVGTSPKDQSIVVWNLTSYGHVGYVERVEGDKIYVWDSARTCFDTENPEFKECMANSVSEASDKICYQNTKTIACEYTTSYIEVIGYIYLDEVPKNTNTSTNTNSSSKATTPIITKSNNNYLSSLTLDTGEIAFSKDITHYTLEVAYDEERIIVNALAEDSKSTITGIGEYQLKVGNNLLTIVVNAEDGSKKEYEILVIRNEKPVVITVGGDTVEVINENRKTNYKKLIIALVISGISLIGFIITISILVKKKK